MSNKESLSDETPWSSNALGTPTSTTTISSPWAAPKAPLPPHRLAKLANALGVSTPVPVHHRKVWDPTLSPSAISLNTPDTLAFRRSPTPSTATSMSNYYPTTSKYLLHVIPPLNLPHDSASNDSGLTPPPSSASGYHTQFRRGTLVPVHATFQAQLWAIAKEYALPSTTGLVLYLVANPRTPSSQTTPTMEDMEDEPGPRLSEDIWKHLWTRVWKAEREEALSPGLPGSPGLVGLGIGMRSTPHLLQDGSTSGRSTPLRPFLSAEKTYPYPSPSTPSTASISVSRSNSKSTVSSFRSPTSGTYTSDNADAEPDTPLTSDPDTDLMALRANSLPLPGIHLPSIIPILAKVEFDIDKKKAGWYEPWLKSRKRNFKKRKGNANATEKDDSDEKRALIALKLTGRTQTSSPVSMFSTKEQEGYARLSDDDDDDDNDNKNDGGEQEDEDEDEESSYEEDDETARVASTSGPDLKSARLKRRRGPHDLALTGEELEEDFDAEDGNENEGEEGELTRNANEIHEIMASMEAGNRPNLSVAIPLSDSPANALARKNIPPPLVLHPVGGTASTELTVPSPLNSAAGLDSEGSSGSGGTSLPYLKGVTPDYEATSDDDTGEGAPGEDSLDEYTKMRSPADSEKRTGGVFDDLDLGLDASGEFDDSDPHDRRRSQYILKAKLDEIERNLAQLSPRALKIDLEEEQSLHAHSQSFSSSPGSPFLGLPSAGGTPVLRNGDVLPPTPRKEGFGSPGERRRTESNATSITGAQWPAVPFSSLNEDSGEPSGSVRHSGSSFNTSSPPRLAVNGVSASAPRAYNRSSRQGSGSSEISAETLQRRKALEEEQMQYKPSNVPYPALPTGGSGSESSPVIPLSPDPFGRFASTPELVTSTRQSVPMGQGGGPRKQRQATADDVGKGDVAGRMSESSRFSADSSKDHIEIPQGIVKSNSGNSIGNSKELKEGSIGKAGAGNRTTVMSMKSIKKLWRRSNKSVSISGVPPTPSPASTSAPASKAPSPEPTLKTPVTPTFPPRTPSPQSLQNLPTASSSAGMGPPMRPARPSQEEMDIPDIPEQLAIPLQPANGRPSPMPIIAAQMQAGVRGGGMGGMGGLMFDQESPYPIATRKPPPVKQNVVPAQPMAAGAMHRPNRSRAGSQADIMNAAAPGAGSASDNHRTSVRKSILKWKSAAAAAQNGDSFAAGDSSAPERPGADRTSSSSTVRPRRPSSSGFALNSSSQRSSVVSPPPDIPPSPRIPEQYLKSRGHLEHLRTGSQRTHLTSSSTDSRATSTTDVSSYQSSQTSLSSPPRTTKGSGSLGSKASMDETSRKMSTDSNRPDKVGESEDDEDSDARPSIDSSQFEMVSPKMMVESLTYPYTTVGH